MTPGSGGTWRGGRRYGSTGGKRADLDGLYVRSTWEANIARVLVMLQERGLIEKWEYEPDEFEFETIKRGTRFYKPDFKVWFPGQEPVYWEVKGYMDRVSKTKLSRMARYYPDVEIVVIDREQYTSLERIFKHFIPEWEE